MSLLDLRPPYDFAMSTSFWHRSTAEISEQWADGVFRRFVDDAGRPRLLTLRPHGSLAAPAVAAELDGHPLAGAALARWSPLVRRLLNDNVDLAAAQAQLADHPQAGWLLARFPGLRPVRPPTMWEALVWAICAQQIGLGFARLLKERLVYRYGVVRQVAGRSLAAFPPPAALVDADPAELRRFQFSASKASYIVGLARAIEAGQLDLAALEHQETPQAIATLTGLRGVGPWTAEYALLRGLGRADAFPAADAGVRAALVRLGVVPPRPTESAVRAWASTVHPWGGLLTFYLWRWAYDSV